MKYKKTIASFILLLIIFGIYKIYSVKSLNYVSLGDALSYGENSYGERNYGYTDYLENYLERNNLLKRHISEFTNPTQTLSRVISDIENNKKIALNNDQLNIRRVLRESDIVTISIGMEEILSTISVEKGFNLKENRSLLKPILVEFEKCIKLVRDFAKKDIIVTGLYNFYPEWWNKQLDMTSEYFNYLDMELEKICKKYDCHYVSLTELFKENPNFMPNPGNALPNIRGYEAISQLIIDVLEKKVLN